MSIFQRRKLNRFIIVPLVTGVLVATLIHPVPWQKFVSDSAQAVGGYTAMDLLGQLDEHDDPFYTSSGANNVPNQRGYYGDVHGVALDTTNHRLFISDTGGNRVLVYELDSTNLPVDHLADFVLGQSTIKGVNSNTTQSTFNTPNGLVYDSVHNRLFVVDEGNNRVLVFDTTTIANGQSAVNVIGQPNFTSSSAVTTQSGLSDPYGAAYDGDNDRLFVTDRSNSRVLVFDVDPSVLIANNSGTDGPNAISILGHATYSNPGSGTSQSMLNFPADVDYDGDNGRLFVADTFNHRVMVWDVNAIVDGENAVNVLGHTNFTSSSACFPVTASCVDQPIDVAYDSHQDILFVSSFGHNRVLVYDVSVLVPDDSGTDPSNGPAAINVLGQPNFSSTSGATTQEGLNQPRGLAIDTSFQERLYVTDQGNLRVMVWDVNSMTDGESAVDAFGQLDETDQPVYTTNTYINAEGFYLPDDMAIDTANNRLFVSDFSNCRVLVFNLDTNNQLTDRIADFVLGQSDFNHNDCGLTQNTLIGPEGLAYDEANQRLFVTDHDNNRVLVFDVSTITNGENAINVIGQTNFTSNGSSETSSVINSPTDVAYDTANDRLFVTDPDNARILVFDVDPAVLIANNSATDGQPALNVLGQEGFTGGVGGQTTQDGVNNPFAVAMDSDNQRLFVSDQNNSRIMIFDVDPLTIQNGEDADHVLGQDSFDTSDTAVTQSGLSFPYGVTYDPTNKRLFVADSPDVGRILIFDVDPGTIADGEDADDVIGQDDFTSSGTGVSASALHSVQDIFFDEGNSFLYVADGYNNRVMLFDVAPVVPTPTPTPTPTSGGGGGGAQIIGFTPTSIVINDDDPSVNSRNVLVTIEAAFSNSFSGDVQILLSNDPLFSTYIPFSYTLPEYDADGAVVNNWPKTVAWDLCFGIPASQCNPGNRTVYARFYVNVPPPVPAMTVVQ